MLEVFLEGDVFKEFPNEAHVYDLGLSNGETFRLTSQNVEISN